MGTTTSYLALGSNLPELVISVIITGCPFNDFKIGTTTKSKDVAILAN